eukprot:GHUV01043769.1.p1 GENE.GHUV01043769.1~~GHUV01043769.1.p1  ORF type:complete len:141 (-),score=21.24 GHUV01043769.1:109-531(-)
MCCVVLQLWLGGSPNQTRLAKVFKERVKLRDLEATLEPLFAAYKARRQSGEAFGDFVARVGFVALWEYANSYVAAEKVATLPTVSCCLVALSSFKALADMLPWLKRCCCLHCYLLWLPASLVGSSCSCISTRWSCLLVFS